jgi:hypothetical protein
MCNRAICGRDIIGATCVNYVATGVLQTRQFTRLEMTALFSALVGSFTGGDLFDHLDNAAPELGVGDARERTR